MASGAKKTQISTRVDDDTLQLIEDRCRAERRNRSQVLDVALHRFLAEPVDAEVALPATGKAA